MICDLRLMTDGCAGRSNCFRVLLVFSFLILHSAFGFEGRITATLTRASVEEKLCYTVETNFLRIEQLDTNYPHARNLGNLKSGEVILLFPHNRSFVRLHPLVENVKLSPAPPVPPAMPQPDAFGAAPQLAGGTMSLPNPAGGMPPFPAIPKPAWEKLELVQTNGATNILGFACAHYELRQSDEVMEIWATEQLFPFQPYWENQPHRVGPQMIEEQWGRLVAEKHLFPLYASLRFESGAERMRFEVTAITPQELDSGDRKLFELPPDYVEIKPLPF